MLSYIYSAELKILCNSPGLSGCRGGRLARSENGAPLLIDINKWFSAQFDTVGKPLLALLVFVC